MHKVAFVYPMMQRQGFRGAEIAVENNVDQILRHRKGNQFFDRLHYSLWNQCKTDVPLELGS
jgi:hypothetical protein